VKQGREPPVTPIQICSLVLLVIVKVRSPPVHVGFAGSGVGLGFGLTPELPPLQEATPRIKSKPTQRRSFISPPFPSKIKFIFLEMPVEIVTNFKKVSKEIKKSNDFLKRKKRRFSFAKAR